MARETSSRRHAGISANEQQAHPPSGHIGNSEVCVHSWSLHVDVANLDFTPQRALSGLLAVVFQGVRFTFSLSFDRVGFLFTGFFNRIRAVLDRVRLGIAKDGLAIRLS
mgnify:CR=1 FL=1